MSAFTTQMQSELLYAINQIPELNDFGIGWVAMGRCEVLRKPVMPEGFQSWVIFKEEPEQDPATESAPKNDSNFVSELVDMGISCGGAILAGSVAVAGAGAAPLTAGTSLAVTALSYAASVAAAAQCGISAGRVLNEILAPSSNDILDSNEWVQRSSQVLDVITLAGGVASMGQAMKSTLRMSRTSSRPLKKILQGMNRGERKQLAKDLARYSGDATTRRQFIKLARAGKIPKVFTRKEVKKAVIERLLDTASGLLSIFGSSRSGVIHIYFTE